MLSEHHKFLPIVGTVTLRTAAFLFPIAPPWQGASQDPKATIKSSTYFPSNTVDGFADSFFSTHLTSVGEPSLLTAAQDPKAHSYRFDWLAAQHWHLIMVRLSLNSDGSARITCIEKSQESGETTDSRRTELTASPADVQKFLGLVEKADFWSMSAMEQEKSAPGPGPKSYKMDASTWVFEGVRGGNYHVVLRRAPEPSPFTDVVRFLAKDLVKLREPSIPRASFGPSTDTKVIQP